MFSTLLTCIFTDILVTLKQHQRQMTIQKDLSLMLRRTILLSN